MVNIKGSGHIQSSTIATEQLYQTDKVLLSNIKAFSQVLYTIYRK